MKVLFIFLLIGISFSFNCYKQYITKNEKGIKYERFLGCSCPDGLIKREDIRNKICNCFLMKDIIACSKDSRCDFMSINGCSNR